VRPIYLDNNATTAIDPQVLLAIQEELKELGNPSSPHIFGQRAKMRLLAARRQVASHLGVKPQEIIFFSSGTEALNTLILGAFPKNEGHLITSDQEHAAVFMAAQALEERGVDVTYLSKITPQAVADAITEKTRLISLMAVNNETGVKLDLEEIAAMANEKGIPFVVDGVALMGKEPFSIPAGVSAICFSAHKFHGPKGVGFAYCKNAFKWQSLLKGGHQEYGKRAGTENLPGIVGLAKALEVSKEFLEKNPNYLTSLRDRFETTLQKRLESVLINGEGKRVSNTSNICFLGVDGESLLTMLDLEGVLASHGSACSSGALEPSRILLNMGLSRELAGSSLRFSFSRFTTAEEIDRAVDIIVQVVSKIRSIACSSSF
jgi:cysteine desulfurase